MTLVVEKSPERTKNERVKQKHNSGRKDNYESNTNQLPPRNGEKERFIACFIYVSECWKKLGKSI